MKKPKNNNPENLPAIIEAAAPVKLVPHPTGTAWLHQQPPTDKTFTGLVRRNVLTDPVGENLDTYA